MYIIEDATMMAQLVAQNPDMYIHRCYKNFDYIKSHSSDDFTLRNSDEANTKEHVKYFFFMLGQLGVFAKHSLISYRDMARLCNSIYPLRIYEVFKLVWGLSFFADYYFVKDTDLVKWFNNWADKNEQVPKWYAFSPKKIKQLRKSIEIVAPKQIHFIIDDCATPHDNNEIRIAKHPYDDLVHDLISVDTDILPKEKICGAVKNMIVFPYNSQTYYETCLEELSAKMSKYNPTCDPKTYRADSITKCYYELCIALSLDIAEELDISTVITNFNNKLSAML